LLNKLWINYEQGGEGAELVISLMEGDDLEVVHMGGEVVKGENVNSTGREGMDTIGKLAGKTKDTQETKHQEMHKAYRSECCRFQIKY